MNLRPTSSDCSYPNLRGRHAKWQALRIPGSRAADPRRPLEQIQHVMQMLRDTQAGEGASTPEDTAGALAATSWRSTNRSRGHSNGPRKLHLSARAVHQLADPLVLFASPGSW